MPARQVLLPILAALPWAISCATPDAPTAVTPVSPATSPSLPEPALPPGALARLGTPSPPGTWVRVRAVAFSPDGKTLASAETSGTIRLWDVNARKETRQINSQQDDVSCIVFSPDGRVLASGDWNKKTILTWDVSSGKELLKFEGQAKAVLGLAFSPDGRTIASSHNDYSICLWDFATGAKLRTVKNTVYSRNPAFSPDGKRLAACGEKGRVIHIWDVATGDNIFSFPVIVRYDSGGGSVAYSPDGRMLALARWGDDGFSLWEAVTGKEIRRLKGHGSCNATATFSPDGTMVAGNCNNSHVVIWDATTGQELTRIPTGGTRTANFAFSPDSRVLAAGMDDTVLLWDLAAVRNQK